MQGSVRLICVRVLFNHLCILILFENTGSQFCLDFVVVDVVVVVT